MRNYVSAAPLHWITTRLNCTTNAQSQSFHPNISRGAIIGNPATELNLAAYVCLPFFLRINPAASSRVAATADWNSGRPRIMKWPRRASSSVAPADSDPGTDWGYVRPGWAHAITGDRRWSPGDYVDSCSFHRPSSTSPRGDPSKLLGLASGGAASQVEDFGWAVIYLFCAFAARWRARL